MTASYLLDLSGRQVSELDGAGNFQRGQVYANGQLLASYTNSGTHFALSDWLGTKRVVANADGSVAGTCLSLPFGDELICSGSTSQNGHHFTGKVHDQESGNDYFGARYYGSSMGRFISPDEAFANFDQEDPQSLDMYSYVENNPLTNVDPDGHDCIYSTGVGSGYEVVTGDCLSSTDSGVYVNGTITSANFNASNNTIGFTYTAYDTGNLGTGVIANVLAPQAMDEGAIQDLSGGELTGIAGGKLFSEAAGWIGGLLDRGTSGGGGTVIGRTFELGEESLGPGERTLNLPDLGDPEANWAQNSSRLRKAMAEGKPIRDAHVDAVGNRIVDDRAAGKGGAFLNAERNLLKNHGWTYNPSTTDWYPPSK